MTNTPVAAVTRPVAAPTNGLAIFRFVAGPIGELGDYGTGLKGHVRLLCNTSALSEHLPELLSVFLASHPGISIDLEERPSYEIADAVRTMCAT
jgi:DNA-binding transcriptional LysR family regulator